MLTEPVTSATRWRSRAPAEIVWFDVPPDFIAFHRPSGKTHFLNEASKVLLTDVLAEPRDLREVLDVFSSDAADNIADEYAERMQSMLAHLEDLGLIERA